MSKFKNVVTSLAVAVPTLLVLPIVVNAQSEVPQVPCVAPCADEEGGDGGSGSCRTEEGAAHDHVTRTYREMYTPDSPTQQSHWITKICRQRIRVMLEVCRDNTGKVLTAYPYNVAEPERCS
jgi:hypothetical protein